MSLPAPEPDDPRTVADRIVALARERGRPLVALDNDGTLAAIVDRPEDARLADGARDALAGLCEVADVAIVSGRALEDLAVRFAGLPVDLVAEHGLRHRDRAGRTVQLVEGFGPSTLDGLREELGALLDDAAVANGWLVEDKGVTIAVHHRRVAQEDRQPTLDRVDALLAAAAERGGGAVQAGKAVLELRPAGADKGAALRRLAAATPSAPIVMVGDDVTDEAALEVAEASGGVGVLVAEQARPTAASARIADPDAVVLLLLGLTEGLRPAR